MSKRECGTCHGTGKFKGSTCQTCDGTGEVADAGTDRPDVARKPPKKKK